MEIFLGIDIGGTNVKFGIVNSNGELLKKTKIRTEQMLKGGFMTNFIKHLQWQFDRSPHQIKKAGVAVPGTINKDRTSTIELENIPELNDLPIIERLEEAFPTIAFQLENDANAAAIGEYYFGQERIPEDYIFITLGTGVGGSAVINKRIFKGADGNGMEIGHILSKNGKTIEQNIGKKGIVAFAQNAFINYKGISLLADHEDIDVKKIVKAANNGDQLALDIFKMVGSGLGECIVSVVRILDIKTILIGGGISKLFDYIKDEMYEIINQHLTPYYLSKIDVRLATLANEAGIIGAASLCFDE